LKKKTAGGKISLCMLLVPTLAGHMTFAADEATDWPCEQAYVPEVAAAVVWDGPSVDDLTQDWHAVPAVADLVEKLSNRRLDSEKADGLIEDFAKAQAPDEKDLMLTLAFAGVLNTLNLDRKTLLSGILRYSRDQERRAQILDRKLSEMVILEQENTESSKQKLAELQRTIELEQRSFDDRERSIPHLCTRPRVIEGRIGEIARAIAGYLD